MFDPLQFKSNFPLFFQQENKALIYLDNAATTQKPQCVIDAIVDFYISKNGNANRASHRLARSATSILEDVRQKSANFLGASHKDEIIFTSGATEGLNLLAKGLSRQLDKDDEILLSVAEHHANLVPWQAVAKKTGAKLVFINNNLEDIDSKLTHKTKIVSCSAVSNVFGQFNGVDRFKRIKKKYPDIFLIIDASQMVGKTPVNVNDNFCDFLVCSPHKFYGPTGVGLLYGRRDRLRCLNVSKFGGEMIESVDLFESSYAEPPYCFEAGTSSLAAIAGLGACIGFIESQFEKGMLAYEKKLIGYLHERLSVFINDFPEISLQTKVKDNIGIAAISSNRYSMADLGFWLDEHDIAVRVGDHCAQPLLKSLGLTSVLRVSVAPYNTFEDVDALIQCLYDFFKKNNENLCTTAPFFLTGDESASDYKDELSAINYHDFLTTKSWANKYTKILSLGKLVAKKPFLHKDRYLVSGCEASLWIHVIEERSQKETAFNFVVDSDSIIVKGLAALLLCRVNGKSAEHIKGIDFDAYFSDLGLEKYLSESRFSGMQSLLKYIWLAIDK